MQNPSQWVVTQANTGDNFTPVVIGTFATEQVAKEAADKLHTEMCEKVDEANPNGGGILPYAFGVWSQCDYNAAHGQPDAVTCSCERCGNVEYKPLHTCPYKADVNNDSESLCNCCGSCENECAADV